MFYRVVIYCFDKLIFHIHKATIIYDLWEIKCIMCPCSRQGQSKLRAMSSRQKKGSTDDTLPEMDPWLSLAPPLQDLGVHDPVSLEIPHGVSVRSTS